MPRPADVIADPRQAWCLRFVHSRCGASTATVLTDTSGLPPTGQRNTPRELALSELFLRNEAGGSQDHDHLVVVALRRPSSDGREVVTIHVLTPGTLRESTRHTATGTVFNDIPIRAGVERLGPLSLLVYRLRRTPRLERTTAAIGRLADALATLTSSDGAPELARAALERVALLDASGDAAIVLSARDIEFAPAVADVEQYLAVLNPERVGARERRLWLVNRQLREGASREASTAVTTRNYALLRLGPQSTRESVRRYIEDLRKQYELKREQLSAAGEGESYESFVERELEQRRRRLIEAMYSHHKMYPLVTRVALEAAHNLEETVYLGTEPPSRFQTLIEEMRAETLATYGVRLPGIRVRLNQTDLPPSTYLIMIDEIPLVMGTVDPARHLTTATVDDLARLGITADRADIPGSLQREGAWIAIDHAAAVEAAGHRTYDAGEHITLHLQSVLERNLSGFARTDELADALVKAAGSDALLERVRSAPGGLPRFRAVLRALLDEELPIVGTRTLAERYLELEDTPAYELSEALRCTAEVMAHLNRDIARWRVYRLSESYEATLRKHVLRGGDGAILALEPTLTQEMLTQVRNVVADEPRDGRPAVLLLEDWRIRPFARKLLELEFPALRVIARREITDPGALPQVQATIEAEEGWAR